MTSPRLASVDELLALLDSAGSEREDAAAQHWERVLMQPDHPLQTDDVSAYLPLWLGEGALPPLEGFRVLDLGCGLGRDARWFARQGAHVTAVDVAPAVVEEARRRTPAELSPSEPGGSVEYVTMDVLRDDVVPNGPFHVVHDSGFFHHVSPPRRLSYVQLLDRELLPGGFFALCTFAAGAGSGASEESDEVLLLRRRIGEGIAYSLDELSSIFGREPGLMMIDAGPVVELPEYAEPTFAADFLQAAVFRRPA